MNTEERIKEILKDMKNFKYEDIDMSILKLQLENLVTQAKLEEIKKLWLKQLKFQPNY